MQHIQPVVSFFASLLAKTWEKIKKYQLFLTTSMSILALILVMLIVHSYVTHINVLLLTGPSGGAGDEYGRKIAAKANNKRSFWKRVNITPYPTQGFEENRRRVEHDHDGATIAFTHSGFAESPNVRTLLPLDSTHLHIICHKKTLKFFDEREGLNVVEGVDFGTLIGAMKEKIQSYKKNNTKQALNDLIWTKFTFFFGPVDSGTRQLAHHVCDHYGISPDQFDTHLVSNWLEMRSALRRGDLFVAFCLGPKNSKIIQDIANDGQCILADLGNDVEALKQRLPQIGIGNLAANSYGPESGFCPKSIQTITTKSMLICPKHLRTSDAYALTSIAMEALGKSAPANDSELSFPIHPGADLLFNSKPLWWETALKYGWPLLVPILIGLLAHFASLANRTLNGEDIGEEETVDEEGIVGHEYVDERFTLLEQEVKGLVEELSATPGSLSEQEYERLVLRVGELKNKVAEAIRELALASDKSAILVEGMREVGAEFALIGSPAHENRGQPGENGDAFLPS